MDSLKLSVSLIDVCLFSCFLIHDSCFYVCVRCFSSIIDVIFIGREKLVIVESIFKIEQYDCCVNSSCFLK